MLHNITVKKREEKEILEYWIIRAVKEKHLDLGIQNHIVGEKEIYKEPEIEEIAQFLSDKKADFVSVHHYYRFV